MKTINIDGHEFAAEDCINGVLLNPELPKRFDDTPNDQRPDDQRKWWYRPFIVTNTIEEMDEFYSGRTDEYADEGRARWVEGRVKWLQAWPSGVRFETRCLDGGAWDRSTSWGMFATIEEALQCVSSRDAHRFEKMLAPHVQPRD
ncbi:MAG TPA: hypothetical protein VJS30_15585 [Paraburkholderia sp.]|nr:hypothetical protein [Paraburkholderia sp.]